MISLIFPDKKDGHHPQREVPVFLVSRRIYPATRPKAIASAGAFSSRNLCDRLAVFTVVVAGVGLEEAGLLCLGREEHQLPLACP